MRSSSQAPRIIYAIFFLSGTAALIFETLWFRQASLTFGSSVWASSLVLASFMAGLALGNGLVARHGARVRRPVQLYALLEAVIAVAGVVLVWVLPALTGLLLPLLRPFFDSSWILNPLRLAVGFALLLFPATAMGATLPLLVKVLIRRDSNFGSVLGRLYGLNTLGAVLGALAGETVLIAWVGVRGTAALAGGLSLVAAAGALALAGRLEPRESEAGTARPLRISRPAGALLAGAFLSGGILLALEVVWFRFLRLFIHGGSLAFAVMLATVLAGIGIGSLAAGLWCRRDPHAFRHASSLGFATGCVSVAVYFGFDAAIAPYGAEYLRDPGDVLLLTAALTLPVSLLSGALFTLLGAALHQEAPPEIRAAGLLTLTNTLGAGLGSLVAGFVLLPLLGMERSFFLLSVLYGVVALLLLAARPRRASIGLRIGSYSFACLFAVALALFPFGHMNRVYLRLPLIRFAPSGPQQAAVVREGTAQTIVYLRRDLLGEPVSHRLLTDGFAMAETSDRGRRYMKLFVYWPVALHPDPRRALLISYGVGSTAKALTDTPSLEHIDVVDVSREILEMSEIVFPDPGENPLWDPRVRVHVEDGRYFLQATHERYDLITGEPPPPKIAGVVHLYTREYFQLIYDRLAEGGICTYWLPVHNLTESDAKAVLRAYCDVFPDCSLWSGRLLDWIMVGSRNAVLAPSHAEFVRQWEDLQVGPELRALGIEQPEQLGALFLADAAQLRDLTRGALPLVDDFPKRIGNAFLGVDGWEGGYSRWIDSESARERFRESEFIRRLWPAALRERSLEFFDYQRMIHDSFATPWSPERVKDLHAVLVGSQLHTLALWLLGTGSDELHATDRLLARGDPASRHLRRLAFRALADRDFDLASRQLHRDSTLSPRNRKLNYLLLYALFMAGRLDDAQELAQDAPRWRPRDGSDRAYWDWMRDTFGVGGGP